MRLLLKPAFAILIAAGFITISSASGNLDYLPDTVKTFAATASGKKAVATLDKSTQDTLNDAQNFTDSGKLAGQRLSPEQLAKVQSIANSSKQFVRRNMQHLAHKMLSQTDNGTHLYYFLSFSMPLSTMQVYLHDALYDGGIIVFRGIGEKDTRFVQFLSHILTFIDHGVAYPEIDVDPQLFDQYDVQVVPTIVLTTQPLSSCVRQAKIEQGLLFKGCQKANPENYWKVSGVIPSYSALSQFASVNAPASLYLRRLESGGLTSMNSLKSGDTKYANLPTPITRDEVANILRQFDINLDNQGRMVGK